MRKRSYSRVTSYKTSNNYIKIDEVKGDNYTTILKYGNLPLNVLYPGMLVIDEQSHKIKLNDSVNEDFYEQDEIVVNKDEIVYDNNNGFKVSQADSTSRSYINGGWKDTDHISGDSAHSTSVVVMTTAALDFPENVWTLSIPNFIDLPLISFYDYSYNYGDITNQRLLDYLSANPNCIHELYDELKVLFITILLSANSMCRDEYLNSDLPNASLSDLTKAVYRLVRKVYRSDANLNGKQIGFPIPTTLTNFDIDGYNCTTDYRVSLSEFLSFITPAMKLIGFAYNGYGVTVEFNTYQQTARHWLAKNLVGNYGFAGTVSSLNLTQMTKSVVFNGASTTIVMTKVIPGCYLISSFDLLNSSSVKLLKDSIKYIGTKAGAYVYRNYSENVVSIVQDAGNVAALFDPSDELFIGAIKHPKFENARNLEPLIVKDCLPSNSNASKQNLIAQGRSNIQKGFSHKGRIVNFDDLNDDFLSVGEIVLETNNHFINESDPSGKATILAVDRFTSQACDIHPVRNEHGHIVSMEATSLNGSYSLALFSRDLTVDELFTTIQNNSVKTANNAVTNPLAQFCNDQFDLRMIKVDVEQTDYTANVTYMAQTERVVKETTILDFSMGAFRRNNGSFSDYFNDRDLRPAVNDESGVWAVYTIRNAETNRVVTVFCDLNDDWYAVSGDHMDDNLSTLRANHAGQSLDDWTDSVIPWIGGFENANHISYSQMEIHVLRGAISGFDTETNSYGAYYYIDYDDEDDYYDPVGDVGFVGIGFNYSQYYNIGQYRLIHGSGATYNGKHWDELSNNDLLHWDCWNVSPDYDTVKSTTTHTEYGIAKASTVSVSVPSVGFDNLILQYDSETNTITAGIGFKPAANYLDSDIISALNNIALKLGNNIVDYERLFTAYTINWSKKPYNISLVENLNGVFNLVNISAKCLSVLLNRTNLISPLADAISPDLSNVSPTLLAESQQFLQTTLKDAIALQTSNLESFLSDPEVIVNADELIAGVEYYFVRQEPTQETDVYNFIVSNFVVESVVDEAIKVVYNGNVVNLSTLNPIADAFVPATKLQFNGDKIIVSPCWIDGASAQDPGHLSYYSITDFTQLQSEIRVGDSYMPYYKSLILERILDYDSKDASEHRGAESSAAKSRTTMLADISVGLSNSFNDLSEVYANYCESAFTLQFTEAIDRLVDAGVQDSISDVNTYLDGIGDGMLANLKSKMGNISGIAHKTAAGTLTLFNKCANKIKVALSSAKNTVSTTYSKLGSLKANVSYKVQALSENIQNASRNAVTAFQSWLGLGASEIATGWSEDSAISNRSNLDLAFDISMPDMSGVLKVCATLGSLVDKGVNWVCDKVDKFMSETFVDGLSYSVNTSGYETLDIPQYRERYNTEDFLKRYPFMGGYFLEYLEATGMQEATMTIQCNSVLLFFQRVYGEDLIRVYGNTIFDLGSDDFTEDKNDFTFLQQMLTTNNRARNEYNVFVDKYNVIRGIVAGYFTNVAEDLPVIQAVQLVTLDDIYSKVFSGAYVEQAKQVTKRMRFCGWLAIGLGALLCCTGYGAAAGGALIGVGIAANVAAEVTDVASGTTNINKILEKARTDSTFANKEITSAELRDVWMDMPAAIFSNYLMVADLAFNGGYVHAGMGRLLNDGSYIPMTIYSGTPSFKYHIVTDKERAQKTRLNLTILTAAVVTAVVGTVMLGRKISAKRRMYDNATKQWAEPSPEDECFDKVIEVGDDGKMTVKEQLKPGMTDKDYKKAQAKYNKHMRKYQKKYDKAAAMLDGDSGASSDVDLSDLEDGMESANQYLQSTINRIG